MTASPGGGGSSSKDGGSNNPSVVTGPTASGRRGRFIVLGSSGECLPVNRKLKKNPQSVSNAHCTRTDSNSIYSSCNSSETESENEEKYFSAKTSFDEFVDGMWYLFLFFFLLFHSSYISFYIVYVFVYLVWI